MLLAESTRLLSLKCALTSRQTFGYCVYTATVDAIDLAASDITILERFLYRNWNIQLLMQQTVPFLPYFPFKYELQNACIKSRKPRFVKINLHQSLHFAVIRRRGTIHGRLSLYAVALQLVMSSPLGSSPGENNLGVSARVNRSNFLISTTTLQISIHQSSNICAQRESSRGAFQVSISARTAKAFNVARKCRQLGCHMVRVLVQNVPNHGIIVSWRDLSRTIDQIARVSNPAIAVCITFSQCPVRCITSMVFIHIF